MQKVQVSEQNQISLKDYSIFENGTLFVSHKVTDLDTKSLKVNILDEEFTINLYDLI